MVVLKKEGHWKHVQAIPIHCPRRKVKAFNLYLVWRLKNEERRCLRHGKTYTDHMKALEELERRWKYGAKIGRFRPSSGSALPKLCNVWARLSLNHVTVGDSWRQGKIQMDKLDLKKGDPEEQSLEAGGKEVSQPWWVQEDGSWKKKGCDMTPGAQHLVMNHGDSRN
ncbi:hypothetical protein HID58_094078 [Brassica napus]|uniref:Uncharacterized protein n=1 Tax=Brassica napus TaxID=3708 RepID=A0ABQ7X8Q9_BRANA|nr:hypothetical protein HID58_094078 [Brassica napus]